MTTIYCDKCEKPFEDTENRASALKTGALFGVGGAWMGSSVGIAALGTAVSGLLPVAAICAGAGYLIRKKLHRCPSCGNRVIG